LPLAISNGGTKHGPVGAHQNNLGGTRTGRRVNNARIGYSPATGDKTRLENPVAPINTGKRGPTHQGPGTGRQEQAAHLLKLKSGPTRGPKRGPADNRTGQTQQGAHEYIAGHRPGYFPNTRATQTGVTNIASDIPPNEK